MVEERFPPTKFGGQKCFCVFGRSSGLPISNTSNRWAGRVKSFWTTLKEGGVSEKCTMRRVNPDRKAGWTLVLALSLAAFTWCLLTLLLSLSPVLNGPLKDLTLTRQGHSWKHANLAFACVFHEVQRSQRHWRLAQRSGGATRLFFLFFWPSNWLLPLGSGVSSWYNLERAEGWAEVGSVMSWKLVALNFLEVLGHTPQCLGPSPGSTPASLQAMLGRQ